MHRLLCALLLWGALWGNAGAAGRVFYDGSEAGNTNLWEKDPDRTRCTSVTSGADGTTPYAGSRMIRCNSNGTLASNDQDRYESLRVPSWSYTNEFMVRVRWRPDTNHQVDSSGSPKKFFRFYNLPENEQYSDWLNTNLRNLLIVGNVQQSTYTWASPDASAVAGQWHEITWYFNRATSTIKTWHNDQLIRNLTGQSWSGEWYPFYLTSNWSNSHDAVNYAYFDEFEIYTDAGSGGTGSMSDGTMTQGASDTTPPTTPGTPTCTSSSSSAIALSWTASTDDVAVTGYEVDRCTMHGCSGYALDGTTATNSYADTVPNPTAYQYRVRAYDAAGNFSSYSSSCAVAAPVDEPFAMGVSLPSLYRTTYTAQERSDLLDELVFAGAAWVRLEITHSTVECAQGSYAWTGSGCSTINYDTLVSEILARNLKLLVILAYSPDWNRDVSCSTSNAAPTDRQAFADFAGAAAARYTGVTAWEVWNEPNISGFWCPGVSSADYTDLLKKSYIAIKSVQPDDSVVSAGTAWTTTSLPSAQSAIGFYQDIYSNGGKHYFDALGHHPYTDTSRPPITAYTTGSGTGWMQMEQTPTDLRDVMAANGDSHKRIWATEWGMRTDGPTSVSEAVQGADYLASGFAILAGKSWAGPSTWYVARDTCADTGNNECWYGLLRGDWTRKPAFGHFKARANPIAAPGGFQRVPQ